MNVPLDDEVADLFDRVFSGDGESLACHSGLLVGGDNLLIRVKHGQQVVRSQ